MQDISNNKIKNRCSSCNKKIGILYFDCKCNKIFCELHRFPFEHECTYNWKKKNNDELNSALINGSIKKRKINII